MNKIQMIAAAAALTAAFATGAIASPLSDLQGANSVNIEKVFTTSDNVLLAPGGRVTEQVDLDSLRARISQNSAVSAQLTAAGISVDQVIGISGTSENDLTLFVRASA